MKINCVSPTQNKSTLGINYVSKIAYCWTYYVQYMSIIAIFWECRLVPKIEASHLQRYFYTSAGINTFSPTRAHSCFAFVHARKECEPPKTRTQMYSRYVLRLRPMATFRRAHSRTTISIKISTFRVQNHPGYSTVESVCASNLERYGTKLYTHLLEKQSPTQWFPIVSYTRNASRMLRLCRKSLSEGWNHAECKPAHYYLYVNTQNYSSAIYHM